MEATYKEKYEALKVEFDELREAHDAMAAILERLTKTQNSAAESRAGQLAADKTAEIPTPKGDPAVPPSNGKPAFPLQEAYQYLLDRIVKEKDPVIFNVLAERPELRVTREIKTVQAHASTLKGALGILISEKFFDSCRPFDDVRKEFIRRGTAPEGQR